MKMKKLMKNSIEDRETLKILKLRESHKAYKNLIGICISFALSFGSYSGILSLQSSINAASGLGLWSISVVYITYVLTGTVGPAIVNMIGTKYALLLSTALFLVYTILNYYPHWVTLMAGAVVLGLVGFSTIWAAMFTHATTTAIRYAPALREEPQHTIPLFVGAVGLSVKLALIFGSGVSSVTLWNLHVSNSTNSTDDVCDNTSASEVESNYIYYVLITVYVVCYFIAIGIIVTTVDHYGMELSRFMSVQQIFKVYMVQPIKDMIMLFINWKMLCLTPLAFANGFLVGFVVGIYPKAYVSDCFGVQYIGVLLVIHGVVGGIVAIGVGRLVKYISQSVILYASFAVCATLSLFLIFWGIHPSYYINIVLAAIGFAFSEPVINTIVPGIYGYLFQDKKAIALGLFQIWFGVGFATSFLTFLVLTAEQELWLTVAIVAMITTSYTVFICLTAIVGHFTTTLHIVLNITS